jgi:rfaE bifunctional protein kinase chain/domain
LKKEEANKLFDSFTSKKILVIGDVMIDSYLWGKVERISPEAPVPIVNCTKRESRLGGAANVALNLAALGATPFLCGIIGNDDNGTLFLKLMQGNHLSNNGTYIVKGRATTVKTRVISGNQQLIRIDEEITKPIEGKTESGFVEHINKILANETIDAIVFQDYDKGALTPKIIREIIAQAQQKNIPTLVDPKKRNFLHYQGVTLFKPNFKEFCEGLKIEIAKNNYSKIFEAALDFQNLNKIELLFITLSEQGIFISNKEKFYHLPAHIRDIADVSGAGDTVIGVASLCLAANLKPNEIAAISNLAGGLVCEKVGVAPIEKKQLFEELIKNIDEIFLK